MLRDWKEFDLEEGIVLTENGKNELVEKEIEIKESLKIKKCLLGPYHQLFPS
ncbi:MAG: hypothetical protein ACOCSL_01330 [Thermoplasmatota archaeon]